MQRFLVEQTGGRRGWQADLVARSGVKRQTITKWTNPKFDGYPDMAALAQVAEALNVRPYEVVAYLDGDGPVGSLEMIESRALELMDRALDERLGPRRDGHRGAA